MVISQFEVELRSALQNLDFVESISFSYNTEMSVKGRVILQKNYILEVRFTEMGQKYSFTLSFTLLLNNERIWGLDKDNRIGWHIHPLDNPKAHEPIEPKSVSEIISIFESTCRNFMVE